MILKDRLLEKRYKKIMNIQKPSITVQPGSVRLPGIENTMIKKRMDRQYLNVTIVTHSEGKDMPVNFKYKKT